MVLMIESVRLPCSCIASAAPRGAYPPAPVPLRSRTLPLARTLRRLGFSPCLAMPRFDAPVVVATPTTRHDPVDGSWKPL